ncbi:hypothetical protein [Ornithinimicrobium cryptoxanthini]|uniref:hypothetical protein n=1 Tax=Ornithinimicrobium cryptoxanthini TaxID=2934161 RepID=UPI002117696F|nr:hypothetical protein [Ornithinimicrobium cryptoxanthini]
MTKIRSGLRLIAVSAAVALGLGSVSAAGDTEAEETLRLHLGSYGTYFEYSNHGEPIKQKITTAHNKKKDCQLNVNGPLAHLSGSDYGPGMFKESIGINSGDNGRPCGWVKETEDLTLSLGDVPDALQVALDLELKGDVRVQIVLSHGGVPAGTFEVRSGGGIVPGEGVDGSTKAPFTATATTAEPIANCLNGSANSGINDNCYVTIIPLGPFDAITFKPLSGKMSLEGGGDYGKKKGKDFETVFTLVDYDGWLGCDDETNSVTIEGSTVYGDITRLQNTDGSDCVPKPYNIDVDVEADTLSFVPHDNPGAPQPSAYQAMLKFSPAAATMSFTSLLEYDQDDDGPLGFEDMPWCIGNPFADPDAVGSIDTSVIPAGDTWCVVSESTDLVGGGNIRTTWNVVGIGDPKFR